MRKGRLLSSLLGAALFAGILGIFLAGENASGGRTNADIVVFGDSILAGYADENTVCAELEERLGRTVFDASFGGSQAAYLDREGLLGNARDAFGMAAISQAIYAGDFRVQKNARVKESATAYFAERAEALAQIDFASVEIVIIEHLLNDYQTGTPLESASDPQDEYTYCGALRAAIGRLREVNPEMRILLVSPTFGWYPWTESEAGFETLTVENRDCGNGTIEGYLEAQRSIAQELGLEWVDLYTDLYEREPYENWRRYTRDGNHPNEEGTRLICERIAEYLEEHP